MNNLLVEKAKKGDKEALLNLIMKQKDQYYKLAYVYMNDKEDSLDALEDMIVVLYEKIHTLKSIESFYGWSNSILVNICRKKLKEKKKIIYTNKQLVEKEVFYQERIEDKLAIEACLKGLSTAQQETVKLKYYMDMDYSTIASMLNVPLGTVKSRLSISLEKLKKCLEGKRK